jgi:hypothetical protein
MTIAFAAPYIIPDTVSDFLSFFTQPTLPFSEQKDDKLFKFQISSFFKLSSRLSVHHP